MKKWKRLLSAALIMTMVMAMVMGLAACGPKGDGKNDGKGGNSAGSSLAKQYVYRMDEFDFSGIQKDENDSFYVQKVMLNDDKIYLAAMVYEEAGTAYSLISMNMDGSDMQSHKLQMQMAESEPSESETAESEAPEGEADGETSEFGENSQIYDGSSQIYENTSLGGFVIGQDRVWGVKNHYYEDYSDQDNPISVNTLYVCSWDFDGNMLLESEISFSDSEESWHNISSVLPQKDGAARLLVGGDTVGVIDVDSEGSLSEMKEIEGLDKFLTNLNYMTFTPDGNLMLTYFSDNWEDIYLVAYDMQKGQAGESFPLPSAVSGGMGNLDLNADGDLIYTNRAGVYKYHIGDESSVQLMSFVNSDMEIDGFSAVYPIDDDHFIGIYTEYDEETYNNILKGGLFTHVPPEEIPDKQTLVLGGNYIDSDLKKRVIEYNKTSDTHRIVLKDYSADADYDDAVTNLNNDIIAGNMPDILVVDSTLPSSYVSKGLLADIGKLIAEDEELSGTEFMENVFDACKVDGTLYEIVPSFNVLTYIAKKSLVGDPQSWTMEDAEKCLSAMPEGATVFGSDMIRDSLIMNAMQMRGNDFIDVSTGKCEFNSPEFIALMEYAKTLPAELGDDFYGDDWYSLYESQYRENRTLLSYCSIGQIQNMVYTINGYFGEDVSYVGFPGESGQGGVINTSTTYALSAKSANLQEAWNFMRYYLTDEYQKDLQWMLPVSKKYFEENAQKAGKKPTYTDESGKEVEEDYTWWINDENVTLEPLTSGQIQEITDYVSSVNSRIFYNDDINNIITEELEGFYQGQKSAEDVAGIIQSRAQLFVNENR